MKGKPSLTSDNILDLVDIMRSRYLGNKLIFVGMEYCVFYANILDMKRALKAGLSNLCKHTYIHTHTYRHIWLNYNNLPQGFEKFINNTLSP